MRLLQRVRAIGDLPRQRLLVDVAEQNAGGKEARVGVDIEQRLRVEHDRLAALIRGEIDGGAAEQAREEIVIGEREMEADFRERNAGADVAKLLARGELELQGRLFFDWRRRSALALDGALGAILPVGERDLRIADLDERLLHHVLELSRYG